MASNSSECVVMLTNRAYFQKFIQTCSDLLNRGGWTGDICLVIGDDLVGTHYLNHEYIRSGRVQIKHFPDIVFPSEWHAVASRLKRDPYWYNIKLFQFHKLHLFNTFFKKWNYIFYIDVGATIFSSIRPILNSIESNVFFAHSDAYPTYEWKLKNQFDLTSPGANDQEYNMNVDYPQTTIMLYDTNIIQDDTFSRLLDLAHKSPNSITNDQGVIALYFTNIDKKFKQIKTRDEHTCYYDFHRRNPHDKYIMLKRA